MSGFEADSETLLVAPRPPQRIGTAPVTDLGGGRKICLRAAERWAGLAQGAVWEDHHAGRAVEDFTTGRRCRPQSAAQALVDAVGNQAQNVRMSAPSERFADWAGSPHRTLEERYGVQLLVEQHSALWKERHGWAGQTNYEAERLFRKERALDPAYEPDYTREDAEQVEAALPGMKRFGGSVWEDRPLRDLSILRFCPPLESIELRRTEIRDWSPMLGQTAVTHISLLGNVNARDYRFLGRLVRLQTLYLSLYDVPWPDLRGLENLHELRQLHFTGNILSFRDIPELPQVRHFEIGHIASFNIPLRDVHDLPAMPELRCLKLDNTTEFDGIERYAKLLNLEVYGYFTDLTPLTALQELTHLTLSGGDYPTIAPLAKLPNLRHLVVRHEEPPDFTPLADAPRLREIVMEISHIVPPELASLNAMFNSWSEDFCLAQPRPLGPLRLLHRDLKKNDPPDSAPEPRNDDDPAMNKSEARWFVKEANRRLLALLGQDACRFDDAGFHAGHDMLTVSRLEDIDRLPAIANCLREFMASLRHPWQVMLIVDSLKEYERDIDEIYHDDDEEFDPQREREEWEYRHQQRVEHRKYLERKYRLRLQQELGTPATPDPADETGSDDGDAGPDTLQTTAESVPPEYDTGARLHLHTTVTEKGVYFNHAEDTGLAEMLFGIKAEVD